MPEVTTTPTGGGAAAAAEARGHLALALDVDDLVVAARLARELRPWFGTAKIGLELFTAAGPDAVGTMIDLGYDVFLDLKMHDIPTTVGKAARVVGALGAHYLTLHAMGGPPMLRAGVDGLAEGAANAGLEAPIALAVTILTSDSGAPPHILPKRVRIAREGGCGGIVCAAADVPDVRRLAPRMHVVVPGIRPEGSASHDQARAASPQQALASGADLLVIGRAVTAAPRPAEAAEALVASLA